MSTQGHKHSASSSQNHKAQLANAYNELGKELSSHKIRVVGNYTLGRVIGEGTYGKVRMGTHRLTSTRVAIKQIPKAMSAALTREIHHHRRLHHPNVTQLYEVIATESSIWLVTELCSGGELFDYLAEKGRLSEDETRLIFGQLCLAVGYIHDKGVVHRDLKLENVLLDERCRAKLSDFGFTREYERGSLLDTCCGTTGYAAPEILLAKKYLGPEVDIWSLGIILYCLLTGTLPFDDDDDSRMREKIIIGIFDIPEWLSSDARDLIHNILQYEPSKRFTVSQILVHPWFTRHNGSSSSINLTFPTLTLPDPAVSAGASSNIGQPLPSPATSESSFHSVASEFSSPILMKGDNNTMTEEFNTLHRKPSESTIKRGTEKVDLADANSRRKSTKNKATITNSEITEETNSSQRPPLKPAVVNSRDSPSPQKSFNQAVPPSTFPIRAPVRTKRRSVSSILSQPSSPVSDSHPTQLPPQDYASLLSKPAPLLFSTPLERSLLNNLSGLGFDIGQMVHSVLSDACDSSGALWWMLMRKSEKNGRETSHKKTTSNVTAEVEAEFDTEVETGTVIPSIHPEESTKPALSDTDFNQSRSAPELTFIPPTPTMPTTQRKTTSPPITPPRSKSPRSLLSPTPTSLDSNSKSSPSTPSSSVRDNSKGKSNGKPRSGSVSIVQRATNALEAAGLVRKKSNEAVREEKEKEKKDEKDEKGKRPSTSLDFRGGHGHTNGSARLTKSPPMRPVKDSVLPSTPEHEEVTTNLPSASPWVVPVARASTFDIAPTPANSPGDFNYLASGNAPNKMTGSARTRNSINILSTVRMWFNEDRKGKRKAAQPPVVSTFGPSSPSNVHNRNTAKRRSGGWNGQKSRSKRASISSRRSSSVNSRRSSVASMVVLETPYLGMESISRQKSDPSRRSYTPNSEMERAEYTSRPSSIRSYNMHGRHRKSPSASSNGSTARLGRATSPLQKYHRRAGSGSSTRVVRQTRPMQAAPPRSGHGRSNSTASSVHSRHSSRPGSFYDTHEGETQRTNSPLLQNQTSKSLDETPRRNTYSTVLVAHKKQTPFGGPSAYSLSPSISRSSWKKAWGTEPPGWKSRTTQYPVEVLAVFPGTEQASSIRDVFSGRHSMNLGDDSDWVDEDEDIQAFAGGLGQISTTGSSVEQTFDSPALTLSPPPRGGRHGKKNSRNAPGLMRGPPGYFESRSKPGHSPITGSMPLPGGDNIYDSTLEMSESRVSRRQLPSGRSVPSIKPQVIQEEDEEGESDDA